VLPLRGPVSRLARVFFYVKGRSFIQSDSGATLRPISLSLIPVRAGLVYPERNEGPRPRTYFQEGGPIPLSFPMLVRA